MYGDSSHAHIWIGAIAFLVFLVVVLVVILGHVLFVVLAVLDTT